MKLVFGLLLLITLSCSKEEDEHCYKCTTTVRVSPSNLGGNSTSYANVCGTAEEIKRAQERGTSTATSRRGNISVTVRTTTICRRR